MMPMMPLSRRRTLQLFALLAAWAIVVIARLAQIQLVRHDDYMLRARRQQERTVVLGPVRGSILDARGRVLAESVSAESIYADPQAVGDPVAVGRALAKIPGLRIDADDVIRSLRSDGSFVWVARRVPLEVTRQVRSLALPGIYFIQDHRRSYPRQSLAANVIGYVGLDGEGLGGVELAAERFMHGHDGRVTVLRDARRGTYLLGGEGSNKPVDGANVVLTIDSVVQFLAERALSRAVSKYHAAGGSVIVMDPNDGAILAMASLPTFDPNRFGDFPAEDWKNRPVQDLYEPGSTFKIVTASAGLEEGIVTPSQILDCGSGKINIGSVEIHEHGHAKYGLMSFADVLVHSSNVGAIRVGLALGPQRLSRYIRSFGFGERTGIQLPGEGIGIVRRKERWSLLSNAAISMGQEIAVTPLQIVRATAAVANGGVLVPPRIIDRIVDPEGDVIYRPPHKEGERIISERTAAVLNEILKQVVERGTGVNAALSDHIAAGKTGTAQKAVKGGYSADKFVASFAGYVPADRPRLAILVVVDEPKGSQYGGTVAAPVFHEVAESTLRYLGVPPTIPSRRIGTGQTALATFSQRTDEGSHAAEPASMTPRVPGAAPDLRGLDARAAIALAVGRGLSVEAVGSGVVSSQSPAPGEVLPPQGRMILVMSPRVEGR
jgi:cell division protein FtsI (penicillin-binding protein 3)